MKRKLTVGIATSQAFFSLQEVEDMLGQPRNTIYNAAKALELEVAVLFNKYTIYTKAQVVVIASYLQLGSKGV